MFVSELRRCDLVGCALKMLQVDVGSSWNGFSVSIEVPAYFCPLSLEHRPGCVTLADL